MPSEPNHPLVDLKDALSDFASNGSALAAAELKPSAKAAGVGAGFFAGAVVFALHAIWMLVIVLGLAVGLLIHAITPLGPWGSFTLGFLISMLLSVGIAFVLVTLGRAKLRQVKKPENTIAEAKLALDTVVTAITTRPAPPARIVRSRQGPAFHAPDDVPPLDRP